MTTSLFQPIVRLTCIALSTALAAAALFAGCGSSNDSSSGITCGAGTKNQNGQCVPDGTGGTAGGAGSAGAGGTSGVAGSGGASGTGGTSAIPPCPSDVSTIAYQCDREAACEGVPVDRTHSCETKCYPPDPPVVAVEAPFDGSIRIRNDIGNLCAPLGSQCAGKSYFDSVEMKVYFTDTSKSSVLVFEIAEPWRVADGSYDAPNTCVEESTGCAYLPLLAGSIQGVGEVWFLSADTAPPVSAIHTYTTETAPPGCKKLLQSP